MDAYDDDLEPQGGEGAATAPAASTDAIAAEVEKLKKENYKLRAKARKAELGAKFGPDVVELIPEALPADEWESYAERLQAFRGAPAEEASTAAAEQPAELTEERKQAEAAMAAVVRTPSSSPASPEPLSAREMGDLIARDPAAAIAAMKAKYGDKPTF